MDLFDFDDNPMPAGGRAVPLVARDGVRLRAAFWPARGEVPVGTLCLFPGRAEFIEKYYEVIGHFLDRGFAVAALDWRGQGGSQRLLPDGTKGHVRRFSDFDLDLDAFVEGVVRRLAPTPCHVLAHSMGANVLLTHAASGKGGWIARMVLTAPFLDFGRTPLPRSMVGKVARTLTYLGFGRCFIPTPMRKVAEVDAFAGNPLTHDRVRFERTMRMLDAHPELGIAAPTIGWIRAAVQSMALFEDPRLPQRFKTPTLMVGCGADHVVSTPAIERLAARLKMAGYLHLPGARHEALMEIDRHRRPLLAAIDAFLPGEHLPGEGGSAAATMPRQAGEDAEAPAVAATVSAGGEQA